MATQWLGGLFDQTASLIVANSLHVYAGSFGQLTYRDFHDRTHTVRALHMGVAVVTWIGVNPAVYIFSNAIPPVLGDLPWVVMLLIVNAFVVASLAWVFIPILTKLLRHWLEPEPAHE